MDTLTQLTNSFNNINFIVIETEYSIQYVPYLNNNIIQILLTEEKDDYCKYKLDIGIGEYTIYNSTGDNLINMLKDAKETIRNIYIALPELL